MIAAHCAAEPLSRTEVQRLFVCLGHAPGRRQWSQTDGACLFGALARTSGDEETPCRTADGRIVLFEGQLHNHADLAQRFGPASDAALYGAAVWHWGDRADQHVIGHYCAIVVDPAKGSLRLARSPFAAPPLHYRCDARGITASPLLRVVNWQVDGRANADLVMLAQRMLCDFGAEGRGWYEGTGRVPLGRAIDVSAGGVRALWRYDLAASAPPVALSPREAAEAALALLDEAVRQSIADSRQPGALVSGGLDSAQVTASAALALGPGCRLHGFTYGPEAIPEDSLVPGQFADDRPVVAEMAAMHPGLVLHSFANEGQDFRHGQHDLVRAMGSAPPSLGLSWQCHDIYAKARELGCDVMLCGDMGNEGFSNSAPWGAAEYFRRGRWREMALALRHNRGDDRPMWRRFLSLAVLPNLPARLVSALRGWRFGKTDPLWLSAVRPDFAARHGLVEAARSRGLDPGESGISSRRDFWQAFMAEDGQDIAETSLAFELLYGIATRDPTAYRPLMELCHALPTECFLNGGTGRWLAREMARGRLPEAQRLRQEQGAHNLDWHLRIGRARESLLEELDRMEDDPDIADVVDLPRLRALLTDFPEKSTWRPEVRAPYINTLNRGISAGRFIAFAKGRNDI